MPADIDGDGVVQDPIQDRRREHAVAKHRPPGAEALITGQNHRPLLVAARDELEKHVRPRTVHRQIANLINDQQMWDSIQFQLVLQAMLRECPRECRDHRGRRRE